jgi:branched-chain amino acid transport system substrate-binding protein
VRKFLAVVGAIAVAGSVAGTAATATSAKKPKKPSAKLAAAIKACNAHSVGIQGPYTGRSAFLGLEQLRWASFAVAKFNKRYHTSFRLVQGDDQLTPAQGSTVAQQFIANKKILAVVGPAGSSVVRAVGAQYASARMALISPSATSANLTDGAYPTFFRVVPNDSQQAPADANFMIRKLHAQKVFILDDQTSYGVPLADLASAVLKAHGVSVTRESVNLTNTTDFSSIISKIGNDTDVVFIPWQGPAATAQVFAEQLAEQGKRAHLFGTDGEYNPAQFHAPGSYVSAFAPDIHSVAADKALIAEYEKSRFKGTWGTYGPPVYGATWIALTAMRKACTDGKTSRSEVLKDVAKTTIKNWILGGNCSFQKDGDPSGARFYIFGIDSKGNYKLQG